MSAPADTRPPGCGDITQGTLLGGRVHYAQPAAGYRTGVEPVLLAASILAQPGHRVVEAGCGAGAGLLCLAARIPGLLGHAVERDPAMAALAAANFAANGFLSLMVETASLEAWRPEGLFDHAFANPPWHDEAGTLSPVPGRAAAKTAAAGLLVKWTACLARALRPRGTLSLIIPAASWAQAAAALTAAKCAEQTMIPLWPRPGVAAKLVIIRGVRLGRGASSVSSGLTLHGENGFTAEAQGVLRDGTALEGTPAATQHIRPDAPMP